MEIPILYIAYKRIDYIKQSFPSILDMNPTNLLVCIDQGVTDQEKEMVSEVENYIGSYGIDPINIIKQCKNQGCERHIINSIKKAFELWDEAIIIEDDIVITTGFIDFIHDNKNKVTPDGYGLIGRNEDNIQWFSWGWYITKENWEKYFYYRNIYYDFNEFQKYFHMSDDIKPIIKSQFGDYNSFTWDAQIRTNIYAFGGKEILFYDQSFTKNIGKTSSNQLRFRYSDIDKVIDTLDNSIL